MKLLGIRAIDILGVKSGDYSFAKSAEEAHDQVLITGGPGVGKTRLLELIVAAREMLANSDRVMDPLSFIRPGNTTAKAILYWLLDAEEASTIGAAGPVVTTEVIFTVNEEDEVDARMNFLLARYAHDDATPKFEYLSAQRRLDVGGGASTLDEMEQQSLRTDPSPRKFSWLPLFLDELQDAPEKAERFAALLERFSASCAWDREQHVLTSRGRPLKSLAELTASEADAVMLSANACLIGLSRSIVLVDRPELHGLEPARALAGLASLGEDNQLILASSSKRLAESFRGAVVELVPDAGSR